MNNLGLKIPLIRSLGNYNNADLRKDAMAGLTVGVILIPQAMAYALLAGVPPIYGLYGAFVPLIIYALFASSRHLSVGPVAISALLLYAGVSEISEVGSPEYISYIITAGWMIGILQVVLGFVRLGFLVNFVSHPVIAGFSSAAALIIAVTQLPDLLGFDIPAFDHFYEPFLYAFDHLDQTHLLTVAICVTSLLIIWLTKQLSRSIPAALLVIIISVVLAYRLDWPAQGLDIVGEIPNGAPPFILPELSWETIVLLFPTVLTVTLIGIVESISLGKLIASKNRDYDINPDQELISLGVAKIVGAFFSAMPSSGSFTRSAVNAESGGKTQISSLVTAGLILATLLFLTPLFYYLPRAVFAAIIFMAVFNLFELDEAIRLWKLYKPDFLLLLATFLGTLALGIEMGVFLGVLLSLLAVIYRSSRPQIVIMGNIPGTTYYRNINRFDESNSDDDIIIIRFDEKLYFGNVNYFKDNIKKLIENLPQLKFVLLDASQINSIDSSGVDALKDLDIYLYDRNIDLHLSGAIGPVRDMLFKAGLMTEPDKHHMTVHSGVSHIKAMKEYTDSNRLYGHGAMQTDIKKKRPKG